MTFNGLTEHQAENSRKKNGSNACIYEGLAPKRFGTKLSERFGRIPVKIYIVIILLYLFLHIFYTAASGGSVFDGTFISFVIIQAVLFIAVSINCLTELYYENKAARFFLADAPKADMCNCYRCGNTVERIAAEKVVKDDYVLLTKGDIIPADGYIVYGDITADDGKNNRLIRNYADLAANDIAVGTYNVTRGAAVTSGYAVMKVSAVGGKVERIVPEEKDRLFNVQLIIAILFVVTMSFLSVALFLPENYGGIFNIAGTAASTAMLFAPMIILVQERISRPAEFFFRIGREKLRKNDISAAKSAPKTDFLFVDKSAFITDGEPKVTGVVFGDGSSFEQCYEIPYPLGTLLARAVAENTEALVNRQHFYGEPDDTAEAAFIAERIKNTLDLEIKPENINGVDKSFDYRRLIKGTPEEIIPKCTLYYNGKGEKLPLSNTAALYAMAEEIIFQGNRLTAYAAVDYHGKICFIGMMIIHERQRNGAADAFRAISGAGTRIIMLGGGSESVSVSMSDKQVTGADGTEIVTMSVLSAMEHEAALKKLSEIKIITGEADKAALIDIVSSKNKTCAVTALTSADVDSTKSADVIIAAEQSCAAAKRAACAVMHDGAASLRKYLLFCRKNKTEALLYKLCVLALFIIAAGAGVVSLLTGSSAAFYAVPVLTGFTALIDIVFCGKSCK